LVALKQQTLADLGFEKHPKETRKWQFLDETETFNPCKQLTEAIEPFYPNLNGAGRRPIGKDRLYSGGQT
jgi:IS5 family transposase